jgi:hypothetical protein
MGGCSGFAPYRAKNQPSRPKRSGRGARPARPGGPGVPRARDPARLTGSRCRVRVAQAELAVPGQWNGIDASVSSVLVQTLSAAHPCARGSVLCTLSYEIQLRLQGAYYANCPVGADQSGKRSGGNTTASCRCRAKRLVGRSVDQPSSDRSDFWRCLAPSFFGPYPLSSQLVTRSVAVVLGVL